MGYLIKLTARAQHDLVYLYTAIKAQYSDTALKWYRGLKGAIATLRQSPNRCPSTPENPSLRHLLYGQKPHIYRVIFRVAGNRGTVEILHIRHGARQRFKPSDISDIESTWINN